MTRHFGKRTAALLLTLCMVTLLLPATAFAATAPTIKAINFIDGGSSTVYVNEATSSGAGSDSIKYIYSNDILLVSNVLDGLKTLLGADHAALVPAPSESAGIAASTSGTPTADWADAEYVAENVIAGSGTVTSSTNNIDASAASMATDLATLGTELEAENKAAWETQEAENKAAWETQEAENKAAWEAAEQAKKNADPSYVIQPYVPSEYVPSVYVPLDFTGTTLGPLPTLAANEFAHSVGTFLTGPFFNVENGVTKVSYDINLVCHTVSHDISISEQNKDIANISSQLHLLSRLKSKDLIDDESYLSQTSELKRKLADLQERRQITIQAQQEDDALEQTQVVIEVLQDTSEIPATIEDGGIFESIVDKVIIDNDKNITFRLVNGLELGGFHG